MVWADAPAGSAQPGGRTGAGPEDDVTRRADRSGETEDDSPFSGTLRTGLEYDSNAHRTSVQDATGDGLTRYFATLRGEFDGVEGSDVSVGLRQGGKLFFREHGSDALLTRVDLQYRHRLSPALAGSFRADMKDRQERTSGAGSDVPHQDYNRGGAGAGFGLGLGRFYANARVGWRYFAFRPNPASSSHGPQSSASLSVQLHRNLRLRGLYTFAYRNFRSIRFVRRSVDGGDAVVQRSRQQELRNDVLHIGRIGGSYRGPFIVDLHYLLLHNVSNSYGQGMTRHGIELNTTVPLPLRLYLSAKLQLQRTNYEDPLFLSADLKVDEENRNSVVASLTRVVGEHWEIEGRYRLFIEEFGAASDYRRQTGFVGVGYVF